MADLEVQLKAARAAGARRVLITTDGVFSMDGTIAKLAKFAISLIAMTPWFTMMTTRWVQGANGKGVHEYHDVMNRVDIITGTLGKRWAVALVALHRRARKL